MKRKTGILLAFVLLSTIALWRAHADSGIGAYDGTNTVVDAPEFPVPRFTPWPPPSPSSITVEFDVYNTARDVTVDLHWQFSSGELYMHWATTRITPSISEPMAITFHGLPLRRYSIVFSQPGHTTFTVSNIYTSPGGTITLNDNPNFPAQLPMRPGDVNGDGQVNISDLSILLANWMGDYENANFTGSGQINISDLNLLLNNWMAESTTMSFADLSLIE